MKKDETKQIAVRESTSLATASEIPKGMEGAFTPEEWGALTPEERKDALAFFKEESEQTTSGVAVSFPRWKYPTSGSTRFTMDTADGTVEEKVLKGVIVFKLPRRAYYPPDSAAASGTPPACSSMDTIKPDVSPSPVSGAATCGACMFAQWGSGKNGNGQACKLRLQVFFLAEGKPIPEYISLPPSALKTFGQYAVGLRQMGVPLVAIETELGLTKAHNKGGVEYQGLTLKPGRKLTFKEAQAAREIANTFERHMRSMGIAVDDAAADDPEPAPEGEIIDAAVSGPARVDEKVGF